MKDCAKVENLSKGEELWHQYLTILNVQTFLEYHNIIYNIPLSTFLVLLT